MGNNDLSNAKYVIDIGPHPSLPVAGSDARFPVGRIYCVGRNYAEHAREMGHDPDREPPFFFMKAANSIVQNNATISYPVGTKDVHHEIEMVVAIGKGGKNIPVEKALDHVWGYGVGLDKTRRDIQGEAKKMGRPWEMGKSFDDSAPATALRPAAEIGHPAKGAITLKVNGQVK
jgi:fumarylpyruvate hydrolase